MDKAEEIIKRFEKAKARKTNWRELYREAQEYVAPHREAFDHEGYSNPGQEKAGKNLVYDSTAVDAVQKFASNLQSSLVPPMRKWIELKPGPLLKDDDGVKQALVEINERLFAGLHNSNFDTQVAESFQDLCVGTGAMLCFKGTAGQPFNFISVPLSQLFIEEGPEGRIDTAFRCWKIAARNIEETWPDAKLSKELKELIVEKPDEQVDIVEMTTPAEVELVTPKGKQKVKGYKYVVVEEKNKTILVEREQRSSPWVIFRWSTLPGEIYGRGPALIALPDIKTINKTKELLLKSASIAIFGMWSAVDDGTINLQNIKFSPGTIIPVSANEGSPMGPTLAPLTTPGEPNLAQIVIQDLRASINNMLFADPLGPIDLPVKTATEISLRQQELAKRIGSAFGRLQYELIQPLINRLLDILDELGVIDLGEFRVDGNTIAIQHESPLARAQGEEEAMALIRLMETVTAMYGPEVNAVAIPPEKAIPALAQKLNVPENIVATQAEMAQAKEAAAQMMQAQMMQEQ